MTNLFDSLVSGCVACNKDENILSWQRFMKPRITFGVSLEEMVGGERSVSMVLPQYYAAILYYKFDGPI